MTTGTVARGRGSDRFDAIAARVRADGTAAHPFASKLATSAAATRDLADAVHAICALHGHQPGLVDHALARNACAEGGPWLGVAAGSIAQERACLAQLTAAAGPMPSTPGQAMTGATIIGQRHALETLARSDRCGCALGASAALLFDWRAIRGVLDRASQRFGVESTRPDLPDDAETSTLLALVAATPGSERALLFGADQVLAQHRGLWDLLDARAAARDRS